MTKDVDVERYWAEVNERQRLDASRRRVANPELFGAETLRSTLFGPATTETIMKTETVKRTSPNQYRTDENGEYGICTCELREGDWIATTHEFRAFGKTEPEALAKLGRFMQEAGESIRKLAARRQGNATRCCGAPVEMIGLIDQARCSACLRINPEMQQAQTPKHPTDPPHCRTCGEYGCTKHNAQEAPIEK